MTSSRSTSIAARRKVDRIADEIAASGEKTEPCGDCRKRHVCEDCRVAIAKVVEETGHANTPTHPINWGSKQHTLFEE
jgi:hypothetical protein